MRKNKKRTLAATEAKRNKFPKADKNKINSKKEDKIETFESEENPKFLILRRNYFRPNQ